MLVLSLTTAVPISNGVSKEYDRAVTHSSDKRVESPDGCAPKRAQQLPEQRHRLSDAAGCPRE